MIMWICELCIDWKVVWIKSKYDYMWISEICIGIELCIDLKVGSEFEIEKCIESNGD